MVFVNNFSNDNFGYNKEEVNSFVDYVIKKTEDNILTIKKQNDEIEYLKKELDRLKKLEDSYNYVQKQIEENAKYEASLIIKQAKDNASLIVNDALLKAEKLEKEHEHLKESIKSYKRKTKSIIKEQLELLEDIEIL